MLIAIDKFDRRVEIDDSLKGERYFCPICQKEVVTKKGATRNHHYAHKSTKSKNNDYHSICLDNWHYDMSEWNYNWKKLYPKNNIETIVNKEGEKHYADVLINDTALFFQYPNISTDEFLYRTNFFASMNYKVIWIFDLREEFKNAKIQQRYSKYNFQEFTWKYVKKVFKGLKVENNNYNIYFQIADEGEDSIRKIIKSDLNFKYFYTDIKHSYSINSFVEKSLNNIDDLITIKNLHQTVHELKSKGNTILELWTNETKWMIVENIETGKKYKMYYNPREDIKLYNKVYGCLSSEIYKDSKGNERYYFYDNKVRLWNWDKPIWKAIKRIINLKEEKNNNIKNENVVKNEAPVTIGELMQKDKLATYMIVKCLADNKYYYLEFIPDKVIKTLRKCIPYQYNVVTKEKSIVNRSSNYYVYLQKKQWIKVE